MITIGMNYRVLPGKEASFEEKFRDVLGAFEESSGHERSFLYRDVDSAQSYLILSEWRDKESFTRFIRSDEFRAVTAWGKEEILAGRPSHKIYGDESA